MTVTIPIEFGYVIMTGCMTQVVNFFLIFRVVKARKLYNVKYPALYATADEKTGLTETQALDFNAVQRGHQNFVENYPFFLFYLATAGISYPKLASSLGLGWLAFRMLYAVNYTGNNPGGRNLGGAPAFVCLNGLIGLAFYGALKMSNIA